jgi:hypothetical protein
VEITYFLYTTDLSGHPKAEHDTAFRSLRKEEQNPNIVQICKPMLLMGVLIYAVKKSPT